MSTATTHVIELDDHELALLVQMIGRRNPSLPELHPQDREAARRSLHDRGLFLSEESSVRLPLPLAGALVALTAPSVTVTVSFEDPSTSALGGLRDNLAGFALRSDRHWSLWAAPATDLIDELRALIQNRSAHVRLTRHLAPGRVEGVEVDASTLRQDPTELVAFIAEATNPSQRSFPGRH